MVLPEGPSSSGCWTTAICQVLSGGHGAGVRPNPIWSSPRRALASTLHMLTLEPRLQSGAWVTSGRSCILFAPLMLLFVRANV